MRKVLLFVCLLMAGMTVNVNAAKQKAKHVILIGMDGWRAYSVPKADIPAIKSLMTRSEERRVGKECRSRWSPYH